MCGTDSGESIWSEREVEWVARTIGVKDGRPVLAHGRTLDVHNVIWCTGYDRCLSWIELPASLWPAEVTGGVVDVSPTE